MRDITLEETVYFAFTTRAFASGIPTQLAGVPVLSVLESNNATPITAGVSVNVDRASVTGLNQATVVATAANGYEAGKSYAVYISTGTVGGVSVVGEVVAQFTVGAGAAFTRLGAPAGASIAADLAAIESQTDDIGAAGAGLTGITGVTLAASQPGVTIPTVTNLTNLPAITAGWLTAAGIAASALNGKGDWMVNYAQPAGFLAATFPLLPAATGDAMTLTTGERTAVANEVEAQIISEADAEKVLTAITDKIASVNPDLGGLTVNAIASAVWSVVSRTLTAGTNIALAKGVGLTGLNDIAATDVVTSGAITTSGGIASSDVKKVNAVTIVGNGSTTPFSV